MQDQAPRPHRHVATIGASLLTRTCSPQGGTAWRSAVEVAICWPSIHTADVTDRVMSVQQHGIPAVYEVSMACKRPMLLSTPVCEQRWRWFRGEVSMASKRPMLLSTPGRVIYSPAETCNRVLPGTSGKRPILVVKFRGRSNKSVASLGIYTSSAFA